MCSYTKLTDHDTLWGGLYQPGHQKIAPKSGLRTAIFGSTNAGALLMDSLIRFEQKFPHLLKMVGVATDDPVDPDSKISVQKRIWRYYRKEEMTEMMNRVIILSTGAGIPCYTGSVKTGYFRDLFLQWDPELVIVCCFGQKIDAVLYNYPDYGMYNFHPSDLASKIGLGAQPFHDTINNGKKNSVMTVHRVTEQIDIGPVIGNSPPISILNADGHYPESILSLQEKIPSVCGWLGVQLVQEVIRKKQSGMKGDMGFVDFDALTPAYIKQQLLEPVVNDPEERYLLPLHDIIR
jgi:hypothetical protein